MPKKVPFEQKRKWLESYDKGETEASIARAEGRDLRTVTKGIEEARLDRDLSAARASFLLKSIEAHYGDLLKEAERLIGVVAKAISTSPLDEKSRLTQHVAEIPGVSEAVFPVSHRERRMTDALLEHLGRQWRKRLQDYEELQNRILEQARVLQNRLSVEANRRVQKALGHEIDAKGMASSDVAIILHKLQYRQNLAKANEITEGWEYRCEAGKAKGTLVVEWGNDIQSFRLADGLKAKKDKPKVVRVHEAMLVEALRWDETATLRDLIEQRSKMAEQLQDELETLRLQRILPGHCRYCPGSGAFGAKQKRRVR